MTEHVLADGTRVRIRPITADDAQAFREAWDKLSPASKHRRFFGNFTNLTDEMVRYLTDVDGKDHIALAAVVDSPDLKTESGVGVARCIRLAGEAEVAEAAVTIVDSMQGRGLGRLLVKSLAKAAADAGIKRFRGEGLADNAPLRSLLSDLGIDPTHADHGVIVFDVDISRVHHDASDPDSSVRRWMRAAATSFGGAVSAVSALPWPTRAGRGGSRE